MTHKNEKSVPDYQELLRDYAARRPKYSGEELEARHQNFQTAFAINQLEGAGNLTPQDISLSALWIDGRIDDEEYLQLCLLKTHQGGKKLGALQPIG